MVPLREWLAHENETRTMSQRKRPPYGGLGLTYSNEYVDLSSQQLLLIHRFCTRRRTAMLQLSQALDKGAMEGIKKPRDCRGVG